MRVCRWTCRVFRRARGAGEREGGARGRRPFERQADGSSRSAPNSFNSNIVDRTSWLCWRRAAENGILIFFFVVVLAPTLAATGAAFGKLHGCVYRRH